MINPILPQTTPPVNPPLKICCGGRSYYQSVTRACGHDELVPADDGRDDAIGWATRHDVACYECRMTRHRAQERAAPPNLLSQPGRRSSRPSSSGGASASRTPSPRRPRARRPRKTAQELIAMSEVLELYNDFLDQVADETIAATAETVNNIIRKRDALHRQLRAYGVA